MCNLSNVVMDETQKELALIKKMIEPKDISTPVGRGECHTIFKMKIEEYDRALAENVVHRQEKMMAWGCTYQEYKIIVRSIRLNILSAYVDFATNRADMRKDNRRE